MQKTLLIKILIVLVLSVVISLPLGMVGNLVAERMARQAQATSEIAASYAEPQTLAGPVLVVPFSDQGDPSVHKGSLYLVPENIKGSANMATDVKHRGLFATPVYTMDSTWSGNFRLPAKPDKSHLDWDRAYISLAVSDPRGFAVQPSLSFGGKNLALKNGPGIALLPKGVQADLELPDSNAPGRLDFTLKLRLRGTSSLTVIPLAENFKLDMTSPWPHPGFGGRFLPMPESQHVGADGFRATWEITSLASNSPQQLGELGKIPEKCCLDSFDVRLVEPVNIYQQSDRALKYGFLFIGVTFMAFFLFEILKRLAIHPAQYALVGLALVMFFLLLFSLSEHLPFVLAYALSSAACVSLVGYYLAHAMRGVWRGVVFSGLLGLAYAALYGLLASEDNALLMGSLLLFAMLAAAMVATRRLDWYRLGVPAAGGEV